MNRAALTLACLGLMLALPVMAAETWVVVNASNAVASLSKRQVMELYMGRSSSFPDGQPALALDLLPGSEARVRFFAALTGKSEALVDAYWAQLVFAGRMSAPRQLADPAAVLAEVGTETSAIGYVPPTKLPATVKLVLRLELVP